jgi:hypothetical protein
MVFTRHRLGTVSCVSDSVANHGHYVYGYEQRYDCSDARSKKDA